MVHRDEHASLENESTSIFAANSGLALKCYCYQGGFVLKSPFNQIKTRPTTLVWYHWSHSPESPLLRLTAFSMHTYTHSHCERDSHLSLTLVSLTCPLICIDDPTYMHISSSPVHPNICNSQVITSFFNVLSNRATVSSNMKASNQY